MQVTREVSIAAAPAALWELLWDVPQMVRCVPGCVEAVEVEPHRRYTARMTQKVGPISFSAPLQVQVVEAAPPRSLALQAKGRDPAVGAEMIMRVRLDIVERGAESLLRIEAEGRMLGMVLMLMGVGMYGGLSGLVASIFLGGKEGESTPELKELLKRMEELHGKVDRIESGMKDESAVEKTPFRQ